MHIGMIVKEEREWGERGGEREGKKEKGEETRGKERVRGKEKVEKVQDGRSRDRETG